MHSSVHVMYIIAFSHLGLSLINLIQFNMPQAYIKLMIYLYLKLIEVNEGRLF
jgi:hypothetical protein